MVKALILFLCVLVSGCATTRNHDVIPDGLIEIFELAKVEAIANYRRQWGVEPIVPVMSVYVVDKPLNGMAAWTTGTRITIAREYIRLNNLSHEISHVLKAVNGKGTGEGNL